VDELRIIQALYFVIGLLVFYTASAAGFYKYGVPVGLLFIAGAVGLNILRARRRG
jgi:hypothetical protein